MQDISAKEALLEDNKTQIDSLKSKMAELEKLNNENIEAKEALNSENASQKGEIEDLKELLGSTKQSLEDHIAKLVELEN